jgi:hypothetical protein
MVVVAVLAAAVAADVTAPRGVTGVVVAGVGHCCVL